MPDKLCVFTCFNGNMADIYRIILTTRSLQILQVPQIRKIMNIYILKCLHINMTHRVKCIQTWQEQYKQMSKDLTTNNSIIMIMIHDHCPCFTGAVHPSLKRPWQYIRLYYNSIMTSKLGWIVRIANINTISNKMTAKINRIYVSFHQTESNYTMITFYGIFLFISL